MLCAGGSGSRPPEGDLAFHERRVELELHRRRQHAGGTFDRQNRSVLGHDGVEPLVDGGEQLAQLGEDPPRDEEYLSAARASLGDRAQRVLRGLLGVGEGAVVVDGDGAEVTVQLRSPPSAIFGLARGSC